MTTISLTKFLEDLKLEDNKRNLSPIPTEHDKRMFWFIDQVMKVNKVIEVTSRKMTAQEEIEFDQAMNSLLEADGVTIKDMAAWDTYWQNHFLKTGQSWLPGLTADEALRSMWHRGHDFGSKAVAEYAVLRCANCCKYIAYQELTYNVVKLDGVEIPSLFGLNVKRCVPIPISKENKLEVEEK